jgi:hypothetical protein
MHNALPSTWPNQVAFGSRVTDRGRYVQQRALNTLHVVQTWLLLQALVLKNGDAPLENNLRPCVCAPLSHDWKMCLRSLLFPADTPVSLTAGTLELDWIFALSTATSTDHNLKEIDTSDKYDEYIIEPY